MARRPAGPARSHRIHYIIAALVAATLVALSVTGFAWADHDVTVTVDGRSQHIATHAEDVASLLTEAGVSLVSGDVVNPSPTTAVRDGLTVTVRHAVPVHLVLGDRTIDLRVVGSTVADALVAAGGDPDAGGAVTPALSTPLAAGMRIVATDVFVRLVQKEEALPFEVVTVKDPSKPRGYREVRAEGRPGRLLKVFRVLVTEGKPGNEVLELSRVVETPAEEVVVVGTGRSRATLVASRGETKHQAAPSGGRRLKVVATGYAAGSGGADTRTATGLPAKRGVIAVDPSVIPFGTRVYIPGYGYAIAADTGGSISGARIDLCFDTRAEAIAWGRRTVTIVIEP